LYLCQAEQARIRGTPVTPQAFLKWRNEFNVRQAKLKRAQDEERLKGLTPKEKEEYKKVATRLTGEKWLKREYMHAPLTQVLHLLPGRQLFEQNRHLATSDTTLVEEGAVSVDLSQYDRSEAREEDTKEDEGIHFSDSD
jgi:hypothetical protein